jgi:hypothetical protein
LQGGIERSMLDEKFFVRSLLDGARDALAVLRSKDEGAEDQQIERALQLFQSFFCIFFCILGRHITRVWVRSGKKST